MMKHKRSLRTLERIIREGIQYVSNEHHPHCTSRVDEGCDCDCYAERSNEAHKALDELLRIAKGKV